MADDTRWLTRNEIQNEFPSLQMDKIQQAVSQGTVQTQGNGSDLKYSYSDLQSIAGSGSTSSTSSNKT